MKITQAFRANSGTGNPARWGHRALEFGRLEIPINRPFIFPRTAGRTIGVIQKMVPGAKSRDWNRRKRSPLSHWERARVRDPLSFAL